MFLSRGFFFYLLSGHHRTTLSGHIFATKARIDNQKKKTY